MHGVFDAAPVVLTELANAPDWLPLTIYLNGERFSMDAGTVDHFRRVLDLRSGLLTRTVRWRSPAGHGTTITFERFASLANPHLLGLRCRVVTEFEGTLEIRGAVNGNTDNEGLVHWRWVGQGNRDGTVILHNRTRQSGIDLVSAMRMEIEVGERPFAQQYALTVLDCPPSLAHLADNIFSAADVVAVPVVPTWLSLRALEQVQDYFRQEGFDAKKLRPFFSMADRSGFSAW